MPLIDGSATFWRFGEVWENLSSLQIPDGRRTIPREAFAHAPSFQEPGDECMEVFEVFFKDPTQTAKQTHHPDSVLELKCDLESSPPKTDKGEEAVEVRRDVPESVLDEGLGNPSSLQIPDGRRTIPREAFAHAPSFQEPGDECMEVFEVFFKDPTQTAKQTHHPDSVLELKCDLESSPPKTDKVAVEFRQDVPESVLDTMMEVVVREAPPAGSNGSLCHVSVDEIAAW